MKRRGASSAVGCIGLVRVRVSERVGDREDVSTVTMCDRMHTKQNVESRKREKCVSLSRASAWRNIIPPCRGAWTVCGEMCEA